MDWSNWATYVGQVADFFFGLFPTVFNLIVASPITGVPVLILVIGLVLKLVLNFVGSLGTKRKEE